MFRNTHQYFLERATENICKGRLKCNYFPILLKKKREIIYLFFNLVEKKYLKKR